MDVKEYNKTIIELGDAEFSDESELVAEPDRTKLYAKIGSQASAFTEYQKKTTREIPIVRLSRVA